MTRVLLICNQRASACHPGRIARAQRRLTARGAVVTTAGTDDAADLDAVVAAHGLDAAAQASRGRDRSADVDCVLSAGGDGAARALAARMAGGAVPMALLPAGGGNYLAQELGTPLEPEAAADAVLDGRPRQIAVGRALNGAAPGPYREAFGLMAGVGLDGFAAASVAPALKRVNVAAAYGAAIGTAALRTLLNGPQLRALVDNDAVKARWIIVTNARFAHGSITLDETPGDLLDPPPLHAVLLRPRGVMDLADILRRLAFGRLAAVSARRGEPPVIEIRPCRRVVISEPEGLPVHGDGEVIAHTPVTLEAWRRLRVIAPA